MLRFVISSLFMIVCLFYFPTKYLDQAPNQR